MTRETLKKANNYKQQIDQLNSFIKDCKGCCNILFLHNKKFKLITGLGHVSNLIEVNGELANRILKTIDDYVFGLEYELEKM